MVLGESRQAGRSRSVARHKYAREQRAAVVRGEITDAQALANIAARAATGRTKEEWIDDVGDLLSGTNRKNLFDTSGVHIPRVAFGQTGFKWFLQEPQFGPNNNQVRHFVGWVVAGFEVGEPAKMINDFRESCCGPSETVQDQILGNAGVELGKGVRSGAVPLNSVAEWVLTYVRAL